MYLKHYLILLLIKIVSLTIASEHVSRITKAAPLFYNEDIKNESELVNKYEFLENSDNGTFFEIDWAERLQIFNAKKLLQVWNVKRNLEISEKCEDDMKEYMSALNTRSAWAIKMLDASGRYSSALFWGNTYWLGSATLCKELDDAKEKFDDKGYLETNNDTSVYVTYEKRKIYKNNPKDIYSIPPFKVTFNTVLLKINITDEEIKGGHIVSLGTCLPTTCNKIDVQKILAFAVKINPKQNTEISILQVRRLNSEYTIWTDVRFYILSSVLMIVIILMTIGTILDAKIQKRKNASKIYQQKILTSSSTGSSMVNDLNDISNNNINNKKLESVINNTISIHIQDNKSLQKNINDEIKLNMLEKFMLCFSIITNSKKICSLDIGDDTLSPIHGLRIISLLWVVLVHTCLIIFHIADNQKFRDKAEDDVLYQTVSNATYSVDTFFFISGVLVSFLFFRTISKYSSKQIIKTEGFRAQFATYINMVVYRFIRLTPPYLFVLGLANISIKHHYSNSVIHPPTKDHENCDNYWWRNALYINTFFPTQQMCMNWSWYLANDSQFYAIGILILLLALRHIKLAATAIVGLLLIAWSTTAVITLKTGYIPSIADPFSHYDELYDKPWTRLGPYFIGMMTGYFLHKTNCRFPLSRLTAALGWFLSIFAIVSVVYGLYYVDLGPYSAAVYVSLGHTIWALAIAWILIACVSGYGGFVSKVLGWKFIYPFSRLAYCAYLVHPVVIRSVLLNAESPLHITREVVTIQFLGFLVASFFVSLLISLAFEAPVVSLLHLAHPMKKKEKEAKENPNSTE